MKRFTSISRQPGGLLMGSSNPNVIPKRPFKTVLCGIHQPMMTIHSNSRSNSNSLSSSTHVLHSKFNSHTTLLKTLHPESSNLLLKQTFSTTFHVSNNEGNNDDNDSHRNKTKKPGKSKQEDRHSEKEDKTSEINRRFDDYEASSKKKKDDKTSKKPHEEETKAPSSDSSTNEDVIDDDAEHEKEIEKLFENEMEQENKEVVHPEQHSSHQTNKSLQPVKPAEQSIASFFATPTPPMVEVVPLYKKPAFPGTIIPIFITDMKFIQSMLESGFHEKLVGLFLVKDPVKRDQLQNITSIKDIEQVGTLAKVTRVVPARGGASVVFAAIRRIKITGSVPEAKRVSAKIEELPTKKVDKNDLSVKAHVMEIFQQIKEFLSRLDPVQREQLNMILEQLDHTDPAELSDIAAILSSHDPDKLQDVLQTQDIRERLVKSLEILKAEVETKKIQEKIQKNLEEKLNKQQRKLYLTEQLKIIKQELGLEKDAKEELYKKFSSLANEIKKKDVPEIIKTTLDDELNKFSTLDPHSSEYTNVRNYLDWLTCLPWQTFSKENFDLASAAKILDRDHYGLQKVKERILEFIAVGKLKNTLKGKIICLVGPPGVGKVSDVKRANCF